MVAINACHGIKTAIKACVHIWTSIFDTLKLFGEIPIWFVLLIFFGCIVIWLWIEEKPVADSNLGISVRIEYIE